MQGSVRGFPGRGPQEPAARGPSAFAGLWGRPAAPRRPAPRGGPRGAGGRLAAHPQTSVQLKGLMWIMLMHSSRSSDCGRIPPQCSQSQVTSRYSGAFTFDSPCACVVAEML